MEEKLKKEVLDACNVVNFSSIPSALFVEYTKKVQKNEDCNLHDCFARGCEIREKRRIRERQRQKGRTVT